MAPALVSVKTPAIENPRKIRIGDVVRVAGVTQEYRFGMWLRPVTEHVVRRCGRKYFDAGHLFDRKTGQSLQGHRVISKVSA